MAQRQVNLTNLLDQLNSSIKQADMAKVQSIFAPLEAADMEELFRELDGEHQFLLLKNLPTYESADILEEHNDELVAELAAQLGNPELLRIVDEMEPDKAVDLLGDIDPDRLEPLLAQLEDDAELRPLLIHPDDSAGGLMTSEFLALRRRMTANEALEAIRKWSPDEDNFYYIFVVDGLGQLKGVLDLRKLILAEQKTLLQEIMNPNVYHIQAGADQEEAAELITRYDLLALPVVDAGNKLLGIITIDDVLDVLEVEAAEDFVHLGGAEPLSRPYLDAGIFNITRKRIGWLLLLFVTGTFTGSVMKIFQNKIDSSTMVILAIFIPLLIGTGGNAGSQTTATIISALSVGHIDWDDILRVWWREARVGLLLGTGMAIAGFVRSITWIADVKIAFTVAFAILGITVWATSSGSMLPLLASRLNIDPTVVSGPVMSTIVDATGLYIFFSLAQIILVF